MHQPLRAVSTTVVALALAGTCASAHATWVLGNDNGGNGSLAGDYPAFTLTGADNGSGPDGLDDTVFYTQSFTVPETITFTWQYASHDSSGLATYDPAGWVLVSGGSTVETQLSIDAELAASGTATVSVGAGDSFGFYVHSLDSEFGPGVLAVNEALPPPPPPVPEPQHAVLLLAGLAALFASARRRRNG